MSNLIVIAFEHLMGEEGSQSAGRPQGQALFQNEPESSTKTGGYYLVDGGFTSQ